MVDLEVLQATFVYLYEGMNDVETWSYGCSLSLGHSGTHILDFGAYTQKVAHYHSIIKCSSVGNTTCENSGDAGKFSLYNSRKVGMRWKHGAMVVH